MTRPRGAALSLPAKLAALAAAVQLVVTVVVVIVADATRSATSVEQLLAFAALLVIPPIVIIVVLGHYIVYRLTVPVISAYRRLAQGDYAAQLPPMTAGADFVALRDAFSAMAGALERSIQEVRDADHDRRRLFADLAHELATPTSTLLGIAHALRQGGPDGARMLDHLERESARLERLIADVREVAHLEDPELPMLVEPCDVADLATNAVERARVAHAGQCDLRCDATRAPAVVDPLRIEQVLTNLITNAARHAPGGTVAVAVRPEAGDVVLRVEDSGRGVPDELLPQLGRRLLRVDPARGRNTGGHGLGLSIVRAIVGRHGGTVTFGRAALGGLAAEVRIPASTDQNRPSVQQ